MFDPNKVDPSRVIEALLEENQRAVREKVIVVAQANAVMEENTRLNDIITEMKSNEERIQSDLVELKKSTAARAKRNAKPEVVEETSPEA